ncbi:MAG: HAD family hydrolase [Prevotellaceae bacterium]|nr:HAD family hydrolase [Prevotellaceae bacterium]
MRAIIFDYGGTLDTGGTHWGKQLWHAYQRQQVPVTEQLFRDAYVHAERTLGKNPIIKPDFTFLRTLEAKVAIELRYIEEHQEGFSADKWLRPIVDDLYAVTLSHTRRSRQVLEQLAGRMPMVLVSNFYGNVNTVLKEMNMEGLFKEVVESAVVGIRKPDPRIFSLGVEALGVKPEEVAVIGDSYDKDIMPAKAAGCRTVWFIGEGWTDGVADGKDADMVITSLTELLP